MLDLIDRPAVAAFLFTDIEGSSRLWEQQPEKMRWALASHDAILRLAVSRHRGDIVKTTGDGVYAVFADPADAMTAAVEMQRELSRPGATGELSLRVRCGMHAGVVEHRDGDYFGSPVNRAARIMSAAHGGQVLASQAVVDLASERLPEAVTLRDLGRVRLRDLATPEHVYQLVHPALRLEFPALRSLEATPNNLPQQVASFVGRSRELVDIGKLLASTRLLTLVGAAGIGKTRLSLQAAADAMDHFPDGVWFVELAPITDERLLPQAVASVLGVKEDAGRPIVEALLRCVREAKLLLVLDNCEHLVQACADFAGNILQSGPHVVIIATSREPLHVPGEKTYNVPPLGIPDVRQVNTPEALAQFGAVRLFVERAVAAQPSFQVKPDNSAAIAEICRRLDGMPLAIELAAARVRALSVGKIAERLNDRFRLLTGGSRNALPRQQTLRALIDWSYELLSDCERALFRRLAVFTGGFTLEAAEAVGVGGVIEKATVLDLLASLVEKSVVALDASGDRYRLLETVRQYAHDRMEEAGEERTTRAQHLAFYLAFVEEVRPALSGPTQAAWLSRLDLERENILAAHTFCELADGAAEAGARLVCAMKPYWFNRGLLGLGHRVTVEALARRGAQARTILRCRVLADAGQLATFMGRYREAQDYLEESLMIARETGNSEMVARVLQPLGMAALGRADVETARRYLQEALDLARAQGDKRELAAALNAIAQLDRADGKLEAAEPHYEEAIRIGRDLDDRQSIAVCLLNLSMVMISRGTAHRACEMLLEVFAIAEEIGSRPVGQCGLDVCAGLASALKEWHRAATLSGMADAQIAQMGIHRDPADLAFLDPLLAAARAGLGDEAFAVSQLSGRARGYEDAIAEARRWLENGAD